MVQSVIYPLARYHVGTRQTTTGFSRSGSWVLSLTPSRLEIYRQRPRPVPLHLAAQRLPRPVPHPYISLFSSLFSYLVCKQQLLHGRAFASYRFVDRCLKECSLLFQSFVGNVMESPTCTSSQYLSSGSTPTQLQTFIQSVLP